MVLKLGSLLMIGVTGGVLMSGVSVLIKENSEIPLPLLPHEDTVKDVVYRPGRGSHQTQNLLAPWS